MNGTQLWLMAMWRQLETAFQRLLAFSRAVLLPAVKRSAALIGAFLSGPVRMAALAALRTVAALLVLFLEWGWKPLSQALARLSRYVAFQRLEAWVAGLPPYGALALFAAPAVALFPLKLLALFLFAQGHAVMGVLLIALAKITGTAVVARIFVLTQPQLMSISWFKRGYDLFMPWKERMFEEIRSSAAWRFGRIVRVEVKRWAKRAWVASAPLRAQVSQSVRSLAAQLAAVFKGPGRA